MSSGIERMGTQKKIRLIPAMETGDDLVRKVMFGVAPEVWVGFWGGARRKGKGRGRRCKQRCTVRKGRAGSGNLLDRKAQLILNNNRR